MKIICINNEKFYFSQVIEALDLLENEICIIDDAPRDETLKENYANNLATLVDEFKPDFFFSVDYSTFISLFCNVCHIPYVCWLISSYSHDFFDYSMNGEYTKSFCADKTLMEDLKAHGINVVAHIPFGVLPASKNASQETITQKYSLTLWGDSWNRETLKRNFSQYLNGTKDSTEGYLEGTIACKYQLSYTDFSNFKLPSYVTEDLEQCCSYHDPNSSEDKLHFIISNYLNPIVSSVDRQMNYSYFNGQKNYNSICHRNLGDENLSFECSTINSYLLENGDLHDAFFEAPVNIVIPNRNRHSSISPILWNMMGYGAFFLTHPRAEFDFSDTFKDLFFTNNYDMLSKSAYYHSHDKERTEICNELQSLVLKEHSLCQRLEKIIMLSTSSN